MILAGDVGGTKTRLAIYDEKQATIPQVEKVFVSDDYPHLEDIVQAFMIETGIKHLTSVVVGVPGPVNKGEARITNLPWVISETQMEQALDVESVKLLNDLEATAYGLPFLPPEDLYSLNNQTPDPSGNKVIIAPGTGLGEAVLFSHNHRYIASPSEGGHADFAPHNLFLLELLRYMMGRFEHVSYERVCSGIGIPHIYDFLRTQTRMSYNAEIAGKLTELEDRTPLIVQAGLNMDCEVCVEVLNVFVSILGAEAGNMALNLLARGGVYLGGGIPPRIVEKLKDGVFMSSFVNKGRFAEMLSKIPVYVILNDKTALFGAACYALNK